MIAVGAGQRRNRYSGLVGIAHALALVLASFAAFLLQRGSGFFWHPSSLLAPLRIPGTRRRRGYARAGNGGVARSPPNLRYPLRAAQEGKRIVRNPPIARRRAPHAMGGGDIPAVRGGNSPGRKIIQNDRRRAGRKEVRRAR